MKFNLLILGLCLGASCLSGCNDDLSLVGSTIQPEGDRPIVYNDTFHIKASTIQMDSIYAKTEYGLLGDIYDPLYGNLKSDYICQFYCPEDYQFKHKPLDGKIDSVDFKIKYSASSWIGDSLAPMRAEIFQVTSPLTNNYYTNIDPKDYCNMQISLGAQTYTAFDPSITDSLRKNGLDVDGTYAYPNVTIRMPKELGQKFYDETINNPGTFKNQDSFNKFFPGLYVTNTYGTGNILFVDRSSFTIYYKYTVTGSAGQDSIVKGYERFNVTKEVIQLNRFKNTDMTELLKPNDKYTYIKSPAGVCTQIVLPAKDIISVVQGRILTNLPLTMKAMPQPNWQYALTPPPYLLLLPQDSVKGFFEKNQIENNKTSFLSGTYDASTRSYTFGNISNILQYQIDNAPEKDLVMVAIPVNREVSQATYYQDAYTISLSNYLAPAGVELRKDDEVTQVVVTSCIFKN
ncbi:MULTISPECIES: DUF4270 domain-containing protein [Parabacteroides]|uniref:DUF4270 domain-containing protein n=1 Tax=Parabacteroides chinchillae TaxID=871327 RepID=A0A8G2F4M7_9BACT|nr:MULTISPECIES: DUF4270 domain-containing protein [Parabacteroides]SEF74857.1 protein of unknown function [Parabacteroides chinchillae]